MAKLLQPLSSQVPIVDPATGRPTPFFMQLLQKLGLASGLSSSNGQITIANGGVTNAMLANMASKLIKGNKEAVAGPPEDLTLSQVLDLIGGATWGDILFRGTAGWQRLAAGASGLFLKTNGAGADPAWAAAGGGGGGSTPTIRNTAFYSYNAASFNVVFPVGSAVGDVMVVFWENGFNGITGGPAGWTNLSVLNNGFTNGATIAKVMTAGDIATGFVTVTAGGSFNGVAAAVCLIGSTVAGYRDKADFGSAGSGSVASSSIIGLFNALSNDCIFGMISTRGAMNVAVTAGLTIVSTINAANASGVLVTYNAALLGKLGIAETATFPVANSGVYWCMTAFKGP